MEHGRHGWGQKNSPAWQGEGEGEGGFATPVEIAFPFRVNYELELRILGNGNIPCWKLRSFLCGGGETRDYMNVPLVVVDGLQGSWAVWYLWASQLQLQRVS